MNHLPYNTHICMCPGRDHYNNILTVLTIFVDFAVFLVVTPLSELRILDCKVNVIVYMNFFYHCLDGVIFL